MCRSNNIGLYCYNKRIFMKFETYDQFLRYTQTYGWNCVKTITCPDLFFCRGEKWSDPSDDSTYFVVADDLGQIKYFGSDAEKSYRVLTGKK